MAEPKRVMEERYSAYDNAGMLQDYGNSYCAELWKLVHCLYKMTDVHEEDEIYDRKNECGNYFEDSWCLLIQLYMDSRNKGINSQEVNVIRTLMILNDR